MLIIKDAEFSGCFVKFDDLPAGDAVEIAVVGRSNVGKSSFINKLTQHRNLAKSSSTPGKTRTINYYHINHSFYLVDLPGYGYARVSQAEQSKWARMIEGYLQNRRQLRGVIQLIDIRHSPTSKDLIMRDWLQHYAIPILIVATKADKVGRGTRAKQLAEAGRVMGMNSGEKPISFSAVTGEGVNEVSQALKEILDL